jgi:hypothetical protein
MTHHSSMPGRPSRLSATSGVATLYGRGFERAQVERECVAEFERDVRTRGERLPEFRLQRAVELDGVYLRDAVGEVAG